MSTTITDELTAFYQELEGDVTDRSNPKSGGFADFRELAFTELVAESLEEAGILESPTVCHYEGGQGAASVKVSGFGIPDEDSRLDLFVALYQPASDTPGTLNAVDVDTAFNKLERFLAQAMMNLHDRLDPASEPFAMARQIDSLAGKIDRVNFLLFTNCRLSQRRERERKNTVPGMKASYEVWDVERLRRLRESGSTSEPVSVNLRDLPQGGLPCTRLTDRDDINICVTIFPGTLLSQLYDDYGSKLLELNVRAYLQARGKVNAGILETVQKHPDDFMAYNNGITVVAEKVEFGRLKDGTEGLLSLTGMQIVNGGQTTASIHRAEKELEADLSRVFVQGKVTVVPAERFQEMVPLISRYSNSQNKVSESDLSANHAFHIGMARVALREWSPDQTSKWFYERARGAYQTARQREGSSEAKRRDFDARFPSQQRYSKEDLAKFENAWRGFPHMVSRGGQKSFVFFMRDLTERLGRFPDGWDPEPELYRNYVAKGILFRSVQRIVKENETIGAYRSDVTAYTVAMLAEKTARRISLDGLWKAQKLSDALAATARAWAPVIYKELPVPALAQDRHVGEWFKSEACWNHIRALNLVVPDALNSELVSTGATEAGVKLESAVTLSPQAENNVARCMELSEKDWLSIASWGQDRGNLAHWQRGIARTLAAYAAEGWRKRPSIKQAKHGAGMIEAWRAGLISTNGV